MTKAIAVGTAAFLVAVGPALAAISPVPRTQQQELKALLTQIGAPDLALVPTVAPAHFGYESYSVSGSPPGLDVSLTDKRFRKTQAEALAHEISFDSAYLKGTVRSCSNGARETVKVGRKLLYSNGGSVWRCFRTARGRVVITAAHGHLSLPGLAALVASARAVQ